MKTFIFFLFITFIFLFSCQKEVHFEFVSEGSLAKDVNNNCLVTTNGNYSTGKDLTDDNFAIAQVHVTARGNYTITTDTVNGYSFGATGDFKDTGLVSVKLSGHGKPLVTGNDIFKATYNTTQCNFTIAVNDGSNLAAFTLQGTPGACMVYSLDGSFVKAFALDTGSKIKIAVNVTKPGDYSISTTTVNGYSFSGSGTFTGTGTDSIVLIASGTPINDGTDVFTVNGGSSSCTFPVTVFTPVVITNNDHFPLTMNSHWNYDDYYFKGNIVTTVVFDTITVNGHVYEKMERQRPPRDPDTSYYRKTGSEYFEYAPRDKYTNSIQYPKKVWVDLPFLKENLSPGDHWESSEYADTASFGQLITIKYTYFCLDTSAAVVVNGHAFTNVYKMQMLPQIKSEANLWGSTSEAYTYYYAKGIGLIYYYETVVGLPTNDLEIRDWLVN